jgi:glycosyltransferase involved in cell wall biosynthesis
MRVLHVITGLGVGGAALQLRSILRHTAHDADVVTLDNPGDVARMIAADGVRVRNLGMTRSTEISALLRLREIIRDGGYDVVHTHLYRACVYGQIAARLSGTKVVVATEHSIGETHLERRRMTFGLRALYLSANRCSDTTIAVSDTVADRLVNWGVRHRKIIVIPNGIDFGQATFDPAARARVRREFGIGENAAVIGVLGRLDPVKRFHLAIEAAGPLLGTSTKLLIVGDGQERARLQGLAREYGVADHVLFAGQRHDVAAMLSTMDVFVAPSAQETFGMSVLEALANGIPTLYTTCPALEGVATDRARQVPGEVQGIRRQIRAELEARRQRQEVPEIRERYGIAAVAGRIDELYTRLWTRRTGRAAVIGSGRAVDSMPGLSRVESGS